MLVRSQGVTPPHDCTRVRAALRSRPKGFPAVDARRALGLFSQVPDHICYRDRHVQVEVEYLPSASPVVGEPCVLLCISNNNLNLVEQAVVPDKLFGMLLGVS